MAIKFFIQFFNEIFKIFFYYKKKLNYDHYYKLNNNYRYFIKWETHFNPVRQLINMKLKLKIKIYYKSLWLISKKTIQLKFKKTYNKKTNHHAKKLKLKMAEFKISPTYL